MKKHFNKTDLLILVTSCITLPRWLQSGGVLSVATVGGKRCGGQRAESQMWHVTWSNRADL